MHIAVVMGPSGSGKSTVGTMAANMANAPFFEADDYHDDEARKAMASGRGLTDAERAPWVKRIGAAISEAETANAVLACSALNPTIRSWLHASLPGEPVFWLLDVPRDVLHQRLASRPGHYAGPSLLPSQLAALDGTGTRRLDGTEPVDRLARQIAQCLKGASPPATR